MPMPPSRRRREDRRRFRLLPAFLRRFFLLPAILILVALGAGTAPGQPVISKISMPLSISATEPVTFLLSSEWIPTMPGGTASTS